MTARDLAIYSARAFVVALAYVFMGFIVAGATGDAYFAVCFMVGTTAFVGLCGVALQKTGTRR